MSMPLAERVGTEASQYRAITSRHAAVLTDREKRTAPRDVAAPIKTPLTRAQKMGFFSAWLGWTLDGMDSFIFSLVLAPALTELLPKSGFAATPANIGFAASLMFALFLAGWGFAFLWGPIADRFGRAKTLVATIIVYSAFTGAGAFAQDVWQLSIFRFLAGVGVGGEWAVAGVYVAELLPEDRRTFFGGLLNTGYFLGFLIASVLNYIVGVKYGWRAMFLIGFAPVIIALLTRIFAKESEHFVEQAAEPFEGSRLKAIFRAPHRRNTVVMGTLLTVSIIGVWAGSVYAPTAIRILSQARGMSANAATEMASIGTALLAVLTIIGGLCAAPLAEWIGRRLTLALYFVLMLVGIVSAFQWAFYTPNGLVPFIACLAILGFAGGNFGLYNIWLPELYPTQVRATAFAFSISFGRFVAAGVNFLIAFLIRSMGSIGSPIALTALAFLIGLAILPYSVETKGRRLPD